MLKVYIHKFGFDQKILFKNQQLNLKSGNIVGIIGENGTGKSTILNMINGEINSTVKMTYNNKPLIPGYNDKIANISDDFIGLEYLTPIEVVQYFC
ncbi:ABC transporter ATP-binding protein [Clostridium sp. Marseille-Q2269]|uniref:ATP-binding cassette domain-containing protein n=1 Tax=Clostridium sp. Marseille-Q2269 TaxID=2942205 RepID=UPI0020745E1C|nr:ABC transporter ATP-binding protein [Clostridium sp. Marseille-Q2269]